ncbi:MAG: AAA family ATPase [Planctomycetota bacterium]|nr:AAA family ATPase [Planctomycetota bacterium]
MTTTLTDTALVYLRAGLSALPADRTKKFPKLATWKKYQKQLPTEQEARGWFGNGADGLCIVAGKVSGNLEMVDFDYQAEFFEAWRARVLEQAPHQLETLFQERSQSGGRHVVYRCESPVDGNMKLARRRVLVPGSGEYVYLGNGKARPKQESDRKALKAVQEGEQWVIHPCMIETRGEGGLFLCTPTAGYEMMHGNLASPTVLMVEERDILLSAARSLDEHPPEVVTGPMRSAPSDARPGDDYNARGDVRGVLETHGWTLTRRGENEHWCRPGKNGETSATLKNGVLYVFTSNAAPFEPGKAYSPFAAYALLEHGGDYKTAAAALRTEGYGSTTHTVSTSPANEAPAARIIKPSELLRYDVGNDPNNLLGRRWLCRAGSCLWLGQTGVGKSSLIVQAAVSWAMGRDFFGIHPARALKSLVVQGENDDGDLAEQMQGIVTGSGLQGEAAALDERLSLLRETCRTGEDFAKFLHTLVMVEKPDLVWLDPLNCYIGGDVSSQEVCSRFFRNLLNPIALDSGACMMVVHHGNKPMSDPSQRSAWRGNDFAYFGSGSSEMANWARATLLVREVEDGLFEMRLSKRGNRAEMLDGDGPDARPTTIINLEYSPDVICWRRASTTTAAQAEIQDGVADVLEAMPKDELLNEGKLRALVVKTLKCNRVTVYKNGSKAQTVLRAVQERSRSPQQPCLFARPASPRGGL